jgi:hypothetical protein
MCSHRSRLIGVVAVALTVFAVPAVAQVTLTQGKANAGGITPGDAAGYPITISLPGNYKLFTNLSVPANKTGIEIKSFDVTIDFNGFRGSAINGKNFWLVENMQILVNGQYGVNIGDGGRVDRSTISRKGTNGVLCRSDCLIEDNSVGWNGGNGVVLQSGAVLANAIEGNRFWGIAKVISTGVVGFGSNTLFGNNGGGAQTNGGGFLFPLHVNVCSPAGLHCSRAASFLSADRNQLRNEMRLEVVVH